MKRIILLAMAGFLMSSIAFAQNERIASKGLAVDSATGKFRNYKFTRHPLGDNDVLVGQTAKFTVRLLGDME